MALAIIATSEYVFLLMPAVKRMLRLSVFLHIPPNVC
jgi:hypothetical protein